MREQPVTLVQPSQTSHTHAIEPEPEPERVSPKGLYPNPITTVQISKDHERMSNYQAVFGAMMPPVTFVNSDLNSNLNYALVASPRARQRKSENGLGQVTKHPNNNGVELRGNTNDELFHSLRYLFIFGKYIGLIPWSGLHQKDVRQLMLVQRSVPVAVTLAVCLSCAICLAVSILDAFSSQPNNAVDYAKTPAGPLYHSLALFNYVFFYRNSWKFIEILQDWAQMELYYTRADKGLRLHVLLIAGLIMTSAILENITGDMKLFLPFLLPIKYGGRQDSGDVNPLKEFYRDYHGYWANHVPYHPLTPVLLWVHNKLTFYTWNFRDITLSVFARAIYCRFKILYLEASANLEVVGMSGGYISSDPEKWRQLAKDHAVLCNMLDKIVKLFSPIVFWSYTANIYYIVLHVHGALTPQEGESIVSTVYAKWSFVHLIFRLTVVTLLSSKIHEWAHKSGELFRKCPQPAFCMEVERTERYLGMGKIGFTGLNCFHVTQPLMLNIIGVVFTFEIVLLQASQPGGCELSPSI